MKAGMRRLALLVLIAAGAPMAAKAQVVGHAPLRRRRCSLARRPRGARAGAPRRHSDQELLRLEHGAGLPRHGLCGRRRRRVHDQLPRSRREGAASRQVSAGVSHRGRRHRRNSRARGRCAPRPRGGARLRLRADAAPARSYAARQGRARLCGRLSLGRRAHHHRGDIQRQDRRRLRSAHPLFRRAQCGHVRRARAQCGGRGDRHQRCRLPLRAIGELPGAGRARPGAARDDRSIRSPPPI